MAGESTRGVVYCIETVLGGLVKIGMTASDQFEKRMYILESNGYQNITGLKRRFAIEVDDYTRKETLLHNVFSGCRIGNTELFAVDADRVVELMAALDGKVVYPKNSSREAEFVAASEAVQEARDRELIPNGIYSLTGSRTGFGRVSATMKVEDHKFIVLAGSTKCDVRMKNPPALVLNAKAIDHRLTENVECTSPSTAASVVLGVSADGWMRWKNEKGEALNVYRKGNHEPG